MRYWFSVQLKIDMDGKVTEITYDLTYILYNNQTVVNTYNKGDNINPLLTPSTRTGYTFDGWYDDNTYTNRVTQITNISADTTLFGKWTAITYTISYNLDGGSLPNGTTNPNDYTIETPTFTLNNPTKTGNTFSGWTGTDLNQATSTVTISQGSTGNRTYTANWTPNTYNITYRDQGDTTYTGENSSSLISSYTYGTGIQQLVDGTKTGYTFDGWYDNSSCTGTVVTSISSTETGNKTLYAKWTQTDGGIDIYQETEVAENVDIEPISGTQPNSGNWVEAGVTGYDGTNYNLLSTDYTGKKDSTKVAEKVTFQKEDLEWVLWDKNEEKHTVTLISSTPTSTKLSFWGMVGYNNAIFFMNDICNKLYGGGGEIDGISARNLAMSDIEKKMMEYIGGSYVDQNGKAIATEANYLALRKSINSNYEASSTMASGKRYVPVCFGTDSTVNFATNKEIRLLEEPGYNVPTNQTATARTSLVSANLNYTVSSLTTYLSADIANIIKGNNIKFWIATRIIDYNTSRTRYGFRIFNGTTISQNFVTYSNSTNPGDSQVVTQSLRPVIEIDTNKINFIQNEDGSITMSPK